jgi:hypothetical protein
MSKRCAETHGCGACGGKAGQMPYFGVVLTFYTYIFYFCKLLPNSNYRYGNSAHDRVEPLALGTLPTFTS